MKYYKLNSDKTVTPFDSYEEYLLWQGKERTKKISNRIARDIIDGKLISTVWLHGINHNLDNNGPPLLFETMVFNKEDGADELYCEQYSTWQEAEKGHKKVVERIKKESRNE